MAIICWEYRVDLNLENGQYRKGLETLKLILKRITSSFVLSLVNCHINQSIWTHKHSYDHPRRPQTSPQVEQHWRDPQTALIAHGSLICAANSMQQPWLQLHFTSSVYCHVCMEVERAQHTATSENTGKYTRTNSEKHLHQFDSMYTANTLNTTKWWHE